MEPLCDIDALIDGHNAAYNSKDLAAFVATLDPDAEIYEHPGKLQLKGTEAITAHYRQLFAKLPELTVVVKHRTRLENHVVDEEALSLNGEAIAGDVAVYRVESCLITRVDTIE